MSTLGARLAARIRRQGPIPYSSFVEAALYDPRDGFFPTGGGAGRAGGDFITSPEVGTLFGALVARALDGWWEELDRPDPFVVVEAGAGRGRLARDVLRAAPACASALRYVLVDRSGAAREAQAELLTIESTAAVLGSFVDDEWGEPTRPEPGGGPRCTSLPDLPSGPFAGVVFANELLDNLPFDVVERTDQGWSEVRVGLSDERLVETAIAASAELAAAADVLAGRMGVPIGVRLPVPFAAGEWLARVARMLDEGVVAVIDYAASTAELVERGRAWMRAYRGHERGHDPLIDPGTRDITIDLPLEWIVHAAEQAGMVVVTETAQAAWLRALGIDELVAEGETVWRERAHVGDLEALAGRSRVSEAAALTDPAGLGAHRVLVFGQADEPG